MCAGMIPVLMAVGTAAGVAGTLYQADAASKNAAFQAKIAMDNAARATERMADAADRGREEERRLRGEGGKKVAQTRAALASNNMDTSFGSPLDAIIETAYGVERDAAAARRNTEREVRDIEVEKYNYINNARARRAEASSAKAAGVIGALSGVASGAAGIYKYKASIA